MLRELSVQNLALIEDVRVELQPGFCAWTGETGAGKSLLLGALGLLLGERGSADLLRAGADELRITGRFELESPELRAEVEAVLACPARRGRDHPGAAADAGRPQPRLRQRPAGRRVHAQAARRAAGGHPRPARERIAAAAGLSAAVARRLRPAGRSRARRTWNRRKKCASCAGASPTCRPQRQQRQRELALIRFEREELDEAALEPGEMAELARERERLAHAQNLQTFAEQASRPALRRGRLRRRAARQAAARGAGVGRARPRTGGGGAPPGGDAGRGPGGDADAAQAGAALGGRPGTARRGRAAAAVPQRLETKYRRSVDDLIVYRVGLDEQETRLQKEEDDLGGLQARIGGGIRAS